MSDLIDYAAGTFFLKKESRLKRSFVIKKKTRERGRGKRGKRRVGNGFEQKPKFKFEFLAIDKL